MKKKFTFLIAALFALMLITLPMKVWAQDPTASFTVTGLSSVPSSFTSSPTGFTMSVANNGGTSSPGVSSGSLRIYAKNQMTIASTNGTTKIKTVTLSMTIKASGSGRYPGISAPSGSFDPSSVTTSTSSITWTAAGDGVTTITFTFPQHSSGDGGNWTFSAVSLTYESGGGGGGAATTTTISTNGITNTDVYTSTDAGSLSASVTSGGNAVQGATVTWSGNNDDVATINASTGAVTLVSAGSVKFTASYAGQTGVYQASSAEYTMTVTSSAPSYAVTYNNNGGTGTVTDPNSPYIEGSDVTVLNNQFRKSDCGFVKWNTQSDGLGTSYLPGATISSINANVDLYAQWETLTYNFGAHTDFATWTTTYNQRTLEYSDADVVFASANKPSSGSAIEDQPVTKGGDVELILKENGATMSKVTFFCTQWGNKTQNITLQYSTNGGTSYSAFNPAVTSSTFTITKDNLPEGTNAVKITFSNSSNQVGILGATITKIASTNPTLAANDVNLEYNYTQGSSISYTLTNPKEGGAVTAAITSGNTGSWLSIGAPSNSNASGTVALTCSTNNTTTARTATVTLTYTYNTKLTVTKDVVITQAAHPTPSINADNVNINGDATDGSITYTIDNSITGGVLTASTVATWLTPGEVTNTTVPFTCTANQGAARSATVVLTYTYNTNQTVTKNVTVTQAKAPYTTIPAMFAGATSTSTSVDVTFGGWVVSGVSTNGKNVFVTDNEGHGFNIYDNGANMGFAVGNVLTGTVTCNLKKNNGYAQLLNLNSSTSGISIGTGGTLTVADIAMANLSGVNTGALVHYENLTGSSSSGNYYLSDGTTTIQIYGSLYDFGSTIEADKKYDITGIYQQYSNTKEVLPRSANDIVLKAQMTAPTFNAFTYVVGNTPTAQTAAIAGTDFSGNLTVTVAEGEYVVSNDGSNYGTTATFTKADGGSITSQTLYVKLNSNLSAGDYNGRLSFTADYLDSFDVNLTGSVTANPTYNVVLSQPTGDIATIAADPAYAQSGATITLSYSDVDDCYEFSSWSVMWEDTEMHEITPDANNQFTMPAAEVYVSAVFSQKKFTVDYSVNGSIREALQDVVDCGDEAYMWDEDEMKAEGVTIPSGFEFAGWSTSANSTETVASFEPTANTTLYAVLVPTGGSFNYVKVTEDLEDWSGEYLIVYENGLVAFDGSRDNSTSNKIDAENNTIDITDYIDNGVIESNNTTNAAIFTISAMTGGYSIQSASGYYIGSDSHSNELDVNANTAYANSLSIDDDGNAVIIGFYESNSSYTALRYNSSSNQNRFRYYKEAGQQAIQLYKKQTATPYTRVYTGNNDATANITISGPTLITSGAVLNMGEHQLSNSDVANLIIEDGGQLICNNQVNATLQKGIEAAEVWGVPGADAWYFIASPVDGYETSNVIITGTSDTDLYSFDEESGYWFNGQGTEHPFNTLNRGQGYLYANKTGDNLSFLGTMPATNTYIEKTLSYAGNGDLKGFNLMGNPFTCNLTSDNVKVKDGETLKFLTTYYIVENGTEITSSNIASNPIKPGRGFMIQADGEGQKLVFNPGPKRGETNNKPSYLSIEAGNADFMDRAYVQIGQGNTLRKMTINDNVSHVYVMSDGKDYAAATIQEARGEMPVNFKAAQDGQYTITVNPENVEMSYLHLIDNIAGQDIDLLATPSYTFNAKGDNYESRFRLVFSANMTNAEMGEDFAFMSDGQLVIANEGEATLQVIDVTGRVVATENINGTCSKAIKAKAGVYVLRLVNGTDVKTQKIVIR